MFGGCVCYVLGYAPVFGRQWQCLEGHSSVFGDRGSVWEAEENTGRFDGSTIRRSVLDESTVWIFSSRIILGDSTVHSRYIIIHILFIIIQIACV